MNRVKQNLSVLLKGMAMGAANVIPGVSGGTIALITGVFERLINAIKSFNLTALQLLIKGKFKEFAEHTDLFFLTSLFLGVGMAILSLAKLLDFLFIHYPIFVWSFFLGLVLASVWFVGKTVKKWSASAIAAFAVGTATAILINLLTPAAENSSLFYLLTCGMVAMCSMILPGLSGSFVLILMGNYQLIMIQAVTQLDMSILLPVMVGAIIGLLLFSHFLSWLLKKYPNSTIALLTGFILGSLGVLWPWKTTLTETFGEKIKTVGCQWHLPQIDAAFWWALLFFVLGMAIIVLTEVLGKEKKTSNSTEQPSIDNEN